MKKQKPDPRQIYAVIINLPHHEPDPIKHPRMPLYKRAAQFAPFAALRGYNHMIAEEIRETQVSHKRDLEDYELDDLDQKLNRIIELTEAGEHPTVTFTVYESDKHKAGGAYVNITDAVKRVDTGNRVIVLISTEGVAHMNSVIKIRDIMDIQFNEYPLPTL